MSGTATRTTRRSARYTSTIGAALALLVVGTSAVGAQEADPTSSERVRTISVSAVGHAEVEPDEALLRFGVTARGDTAEAATRRGAAGMERVIEALVAAGIDSSDIRTTRLDLHEQRRRDRDTGEVSVSWQVDNQVRATVGDLEILGGVIDAAVTAGATGIGNLRFRSSDDSAATSEARREAVLAAEATASELADAAGVELAGLLSLVEGDAGEVGVLVRDTRSFRAEAASATPIEPGTIDVTVTVHVVYEVG